MKIDNILLDNLTAQAQAKESLRLKSIMMVRHGDSGDEGRSV